MTRWHFSQWLSKYNSHKIKKGNLIRGSLRKYEFFRTNLDARGGEITDTLYAIKITKDDSSMLLEEEMLVKALKYLQERKENPAFEEFNENKLPESFLHPLFANRWKKF